MTISQPRKYSIALSPYGGRGWMGGGLYIAHIFESLLAWRAKHPEYLIKIFLFCSNSKELLEDYPVYSKADGFIPELNATRFTKSIDKCSSLLSRVLPQVSLPNAQVLDLVKRKIDFVYPSARSSKLLVGPRGAAWIPDFQHRYLPQYFRSAEIEERNVLHSDFARNASDIVFSSNDSLMSFREFFPQSSANLHLLRFCSILPSRIWSEDAEPVRRSYNLPQRFMLCSGQFWIHKNQMLILEAIAKLRKTCEDLFVVFTGHTYDYRFPYYFDKFLEDSNRLGIRDRIAVLGMISRPNQLQLMRCSIAVIQPSLFEGWSTVVEDSRACGKKIILSDLSVHREQSCPDSLFFVRSSADSLAIAMRNTWLNGKPGPDLHCEEMSRHETLKRIDSMGDNFMSIALKANLKTSHGD
jgi:glycosyltransferase involved in cell wall biosynthesis